MIQAVLAAAVTSVTLTCVPCTRPEMPPRPVYSPLGLIVVERAELPSVRDRREQYEGCLAAQVRPGRINTVYCVPPWEDSIIGVFATPIGATIGTTTMSLRNDATWSTR